MTTLSTRSGRGMAMAESRSEAVRHTPGPWTVMGQAVWTRAEDAVVDVEVCALNPFEEWEGQRRADAYLIAAAPDMYEALQAVDNALAHNLPHGVMRRVQAALAKAEGREVPAGAWPLLPLRWGRGADL